jgi:hypothetical protein
MSVVFTMFIFRSRCKYSSLLRFCVNFQRYQSLKDIDNTSLLTVSFTRPNRIRNTHAVESDTDENEQAVFIAQ